MRDPPILLELVGTQRLTIKGDHQLMCVYETWLTAAGKADL